MRLRLAVLLAGLGIAACSGGDGPSGPGGGGSQQTGSLRGVVNNSAGGTVGGATLRLTGNNQPARNTTSGNDGVYAFNNIPTGSYTLTITPPTGFTLGGAGTQTVTINANQQTNATAFVLSASGGGGAPAFVEVTMSHTQFNPDDVQVQVGGRVRFVNNDPVQHNATAQAFNTGNLNPGAAAEVVLNTPGTIIYNCTLHSGMSGTIEVVP